MVWKPFDIMLGKVDGLVGEVLGGVMSTESTSTECDSVSLL